MTTDERGKIKGASCDAVKGGYTIFLDEERVRSFLAGGDFSSASELEHFKEVGAQIEKRAREGGGTSFLALSVGSGSASRDFAVLQIGHLLAKHGKSVLIVDCDFLHPGLSGVVENVEEHGFLDLLLYGSSLRSVAKSVGIEGVSVAGPGSFPVSRTIPFALKEFVKIQEFLRTKHDVVIFCSTLYTEDAKVNPLAALVDGVILCCRIDEMGEGELEKNLKDLGGERVPLVELVCFCGKKEQAPAPTAVKRGLENKEEPASRTVIEMPPPEEEPIPQPVLERTEEVEPPERPRKPRVSVLRVALIGGAILIVAFVVWWALISRTVREKEAQGTRTALVPKRSALQESVSTAATAESLALRRAAATETTGTAGPIPGGAGAPAERAAAPTAAPERAAPAVKKAPDTLAARAPAGMARYTIHVSSFKEMFRAETEKAYLEKNGYQARIVEVQIGDTKWLRVFVGEYATMEDASKARLDLLGLSRIGYARIMEIKNETH